MLFKSLEIWVLLTRKTCYTQFFIDSVDMPVEVNQTIPCLDYELLQGYLDSMGKQIVEKMFALYCQQVDIYLSDIGNAQCNNSSIAWQENCHKMKGAAASVGMINLHSQLKGLEHTTALQEEKAIMLADLKASNTEAISAFTIWLEAC